MAWGRPNTMRPGGDEGYGAIIDFGYILPTYRSGGEHIQRPRAESVPYTPRTSVDICYQFRSIAGVA
jgi:hypothetical protein